MGGGKGGRGHSIGSRISLLILCMILLTAVTMGAFGYAMYRSEAIATRGDFMEKIARDLAQTLDGDQIAQMLHTGEKTPYWDEVKDMLDRMLVEYDLEYLYILENYSIECYRYFAEGEVPGSDEALPFLYVESKSEYGVLQPVINSVYTRKVSFHSDIYASGDYGEVVSGVAPVLDRRGDVPVVIGADVAASDVTATSNRFLMQILILTVIFCVLFFLISRAIIRVQLSAPLRKLAGSFTDLGHGVIKPGMNARTDDEIGALANGYARTTGAIRALVDGLHEMIQEHMRGNIDFVIDAEHFVGIYKEVADGVNDMVRAYVGESDQLIRALGSFAAGEFNVDIPRFPGKKAAANEAADKLRDCLVTVNRELTRLVHAATDGQLSERINENDFVGDWQKLTRRTNRLLGAVVAPVSESSSMLRHMAAGDLGARVKGDYKGDFAGMKDSMNKMAEDVSGYINEIKDVLTAISASNLDREIKRAYVGQFSEMKVAINAILSSLNDAMRQFDSSAQNVADGSQQLADFSQRLSANSEEQRNVVDQLTGFIVEINEQAAKNEEDAEAANRLSMKSRENAAVGNREMEQMLKAMESIRESSNSISKVVKVISDIAFQTNLLAINASVEAAHAGANGKGFAVVAEQVRALAARSQAAARETASLVGNSIELVNTGADLAERTESALDAIFKNISDVSGIIGNIAASSKEQTRAVGEISNGLTRIEGNVRGVAADSEQCAALSEALASESATLKSMLGKFELRNER